MTRAGKLLVSLLNMVLLAGLFWIFLPDWRVAAVVGVLLSRWPLSAAMRLWEAYNLRQAREGTTLFLQHLSTRISAGESLVNACVSAPAALAHIYRPHSRFMLALQQQRKELLAHTPLRVALSHFIEEIPDKQSQAILRTMTASDILGPGLRDTLSSAASMLGQLGQVEREVESENARDQVEGILLLMMPPLLMLALRASGNAELNGAARLPGFILRMAAALLTLLAFWLFARAAVKKPQSYSDPELSRMTRRLLDSKPVKKLGRWLLLRLPAGYRLRMVQALGLLNPDLQVHALETVSSGDYRAANSWVSLKILLAGVGLLPAVMLCRAGLPPWTLPVLPLLLSWAQDQDVLKRARIYRTDLMADLPLFISLIAQLLASGMTVRAALLYTIPQLRPGSALEREGRYLKSHLTAGRTASSLLTDLANHIDLPQAQAALLLLAQYEVYGGKDILQQLNQQADACWVLQRQAARRQLQLRHSQQLLPMMIDLVAVILISITPALELFL